MTLRAHLHRDHHRTTAVVAALGATALVLTGCSGDGDGGSQTTSTQAELTTIAASPETQSGPSTSEAPESSAPADDAPDEAAFAEAGTGDKEFMPDKMPGLSIVDTRVGEHDGYDRVVFEFAGDGEPGWHTAYTKKPAQQASGHALDYPGEVALNVMINGVQIDYADPDSAPEVGPAAGPAGYIAGVNHEGVFEADAQYVIGLDRERPYTVTTLQNPTRLVIDFQS